MLGCQNCWEIKILLSTPSQLSADCGLFISYLARDWKCIEKDKITTQRKGYTIHYLYSVLLPEHIASNENAYALGKHIAVALAVPLLSSLEHFVNFELVETFKVEFKDVPRVSKLLAIRSDSNYISAWMTREEDFLNIQCLITLTEAALTALLFIRCSTSSRWLYMSAQIVGTIVFTHIIDFNSYLDSLEKLLKVFKWKKKNILLLKILKNNTQILFENSANVIP